MVDFNNINPISDGTYNNTNDTTPINIGGINSIFATNLQENDRSAYNDTFFNAELNDEGLNWQGKEFVSGLVDNKESLMSDLGLQDNEYDALCCVALAIMTQETGDGFEAGYLNEGGAGDFFRKLVKDVIRYDGSSASSGLTQIKINDLLDNARANNPQMYALLEKYDIKPNGLFDSDIHNNPAKSAIATMIVLADYEKNGYDMYLSSLQEGYTTGDNNTHEKVRLRLDSNLSDEECLQKGAKMIEGLYDFYSSKLSPEEQDSFRQALSGWVVAADGTKDNIGYFFSTRNGDRFSYEFNEERQLNNLNNILNSSGIQLKQSDLDYIRYYLTDSSQTMDVVEFLAYAWHSGINASSMKADRLVGNSLKTIFNVRENYGKNQYSSNVASLTREYASLANSQYGDVLNFLYNPQMKTGTICIANNQQ